MEDASAATLTSSPLTLPSWYANASLRPSVTSAAARLFSPVASPRSSGAGSAPGTVRFGATKGSVGKLSSTSSLASLANGRSSSPTRGSPSRSASRNHGTRITASRGILRNSRSTDGSGGASTTSLPAVPQASHGTLSRSGSRFSSPDDSEEQAQATSQPPPSSTAVGSSSILRRAVFGDSRARQVAADVMRTDARLRKRLVDAHVVSPPGAMTRRSRTMAEVGGASSSFAMSSEGTDASGLMDAGLVAHALASATSKQRHDAILACVDAMEELVTSVPITRSTPQPVLQMLARVKDTLAAAARSGDLLPYPHGPGHAAYADHVGVHTSSAAHRGDHGPSGGDAVPEHSHPADDYDAPERDTLLQQPPMQSDAQEDEDDESMDGFEQWAAPDVGATLALGDAPVIVYERGAESSSKPPTVQPVKRAAGAASKGILPRLGLAAAAATSYQDEFMDQSANWSQSWRDDAGMQPTAAFKLAQSAVTHMEPLPE